jgi:hypothetical protein
MHSQRNYWSVSIYLHVFAFQSNCISGITDLLISSAAATVLFNSSDVMLIVAYGVHFAFFELSCSCQKKIHPGMQHWRILSKVNV